MAINKKLIHFKTKQNFDNEVANGNILDTSIVFVQDSKEISTHGTVYKSVNWSILTQPNGVYIYDINGKYTLPNKWDISRNEEVVGVAILTDDCRFVVAKEDAKSSTVAWGITETDVSTLTNYTSDTNAATDFDGVNNTSKIITAFGSSNAAGNCATYTFPNGKTGYLGAAGEWQAVYQNKENLNSALTLIGGTTLKEYSYWTSTEYDLYGAWCQWLDSYSNLLPYGKEIPDCYVRAFLDLEQI